MRSETCTSITHEHPHSRLQPCGAASRPDGGCVCTVGGSRREETCKPHIVMQRESNPQQLRSQRAASSCCSLHARGRCDRLTSSRTVPTCLRCGALIPPRKCRSAGGARQLCDPPGGLGEGEARRRSVQASQRSGLAALMHDGKGHGVET